MSASVERITELLQTIDSGDMGAMSELLPLVMGELRRIARNRLSVLKPGETILATDLAHDAFLELVGADSSWSNRRHFYGAASRLIRDMLVDESRRRQRRKRGGDWKRVVLTDDIAVGTEGAVDLVALDETLRELERVNSMGHEIVMLRYFCGLTVEEAAGALDVSPSTVDRQWRFARAWLINAMG